MSPSCKFSMWCGAYMGRHSRGGKSKAIHALARRVGKAMYYCHLKNEPFDESGYHALLSESSYPLCPVEEMGLSPAVVRNLKGNGLRRRGRSSTRSTATWGGDRDAEKSPFRRWRRGSTVTATAPGTRPASPRARRSRGTCPPGGLRLRGMVTRRSKRTLKEDLELVTYNVSSENGSTWWRISPRLAGPTSALGETVDLEIVVRTFTDKNQQACSRLRIARMAGEF